MSRNTVPAILGITVLALAVLAFIQYRASTDLRREAAVQREKVALLQKEIADLRAHNATLEKQLTAQARGSSGSGFVQSLLSSGGSSLQGLAQLAQAGLSSDSTNLQGSLRGYGRALGILMQNPQFQPMIQAQQAGMISAVYRRFQSTLDDARKAEFTSIMKAKADALTSVATSLLVEAKTGADRLRLQEQARTINADAEARLREALGEDAYRDYRTQTKAIPLAWSMQGFLRAAERTGARLDDAQVEGLYDAMDRAAATYEPTVDLSTPDKMMATGVTDETVAAYLQEREKLTSQFNTEAQAVLTAAQLEELRKSQERAQSQITMGLTMAKAFFQD